MSEQDIIDPTDDAQLAKQFFRSGTEINRLKHELGHSKTRQRGTLAHLYEILSNEEVTQPVGDA